MNNSHHEDLQGVDHWCSNPENCVIIFSKDNVDIYRCKICGITWEESCDCDIEYKERKL